MVTLNAHYDGKVIVPDEPLSLEPNQKIRVRIEVVETRVAAVNPSLSSKRLLGQQPGAFTYVATDFNDPLSDAFWLGEEDAQ